MKLYVPESLKSDPEGDGDPIRKILNESRTIAVVGLSSNPGRSSYEVTESMQKAGYRIIPVNPNEREVLGEKSYAQLEEVREPIDIVNIFRRSENVSSVLESAIRIRAKAVWMQLGVESPAAAEKARAAGLFVVEDGCILVEHRKRRADLGR